MIVLKTLLVGIGAALGAWPVNYLLVKGLGNRAVPVLGPAVEETLKTGLALLSDASLAGVHSVFGLAEGVWELVNGPGKVKPALAALAGHSFFGLLVSLTYTRYGHAGLAWASGFLAHLSWNQVILTLHHFSNNKT